MLAKPGPTNYGWDGWWLRLVKRVESKKTGRGEGEYFVYNLPSPCRRKCSSKFVQCCSAAEYCSNIWSYKYFLDRLYIYV